MEASTLIALLTALGIGGVLAKLVEGIISWFKGRHTREQTVHDRLDTEVRYRRMVEETLHETRRMLYDRGVAYEHMPAWPPRTARKT